MSYRRTLTQSRLPCVAPQGAEGQPLLVTIFEGVLARSTLGGLPGQLTPGFVWEGLRYDVLQVSVPAIQLTGDIFVTREVYYLVRDIEPYNQADLPELFAGGVPKVAIPFQEGRDLYTGFPERALGELAQLRKRLAA